MDLETVKSVLLEYGWDAAERRRIGEVLRFIDNSDECHAMAAEFDVIRRALHADDSGVEETPHGGWEAFDSRIHSCVVEARPRRWQRPVAWAAIIGLLASAPWVWSTISRPRGEQSSIAAWAALRPTQEEVRVGLSLFREMEALYDQKAGWVLVGDGVVDVGISHGQAAAVTDGSVLRLAVLRGAEVVSQVDVVAASGEIARIHIPLEDGRQLSYRLDVSRENPGRFKLYAEIEDASISTGPLAALSRNLALTSGQVDGVGELVTPTGVYSIKVAFATGQPEA